MTPERQIPVGSRPRSATRREIALGIERFATEQKQLLRLAQLVELGLSPRGVSNRVASRELFRLHAGVFCLHPPPHSWHQRLLAAVYACGRSTAVSDMAAAWLLGATESLPSLPQLTNRSGNGRTIPGLEVHRRSLARRDVHNRYGIPCTSPARTILDCAASVEIETLEELLMAADSGRPGLDRARLERLVATNPGRRGIRNLRELISDDPRETESTSERRMLRICRRFALPAPQTQYVIAIGGQRFRADFCWPDLRLIAEADSWRWHGGKLKTETDRDRDQLLAIAGWLVVHFTRNQIKLQPERTGERLAALIAARR